MNNACKTVALALAAGLAIAGHGTAMAQSRIDQAQANYQALRNGTKQVHQLTPQELADVDALNRRMLEQKPDPRSPAERCVDDEIRREGGAVSALTRRAIDMKCREAGD